MRTMFTLICLAATLVVGCTDSSEDTAHVTCITNEKSLQLSRATQRKLVKQSIALLQSCGYANLHSTNDWADIQKRPHLHFTFSEARKLEVRVVSSLSVWVSSPGREKTIDSIDSF
jgi:hypothetical protein